MCVRLATQRVGGGMGPPTILTEMSNSTYWALKRALGCRVLAYDYASTLLVQSDPGRKGRFRLNAEFSILSTLLAVVLALAVPVAVPLLMVPVDGLYQY